MKKTITLLAAVILTVSIWAQSPQKMSYQAVIRDASNTLVTSTAVGMQISILQTTSTGTAVYVETQTPTTNANGLVSIEIGGGTVVSGSFSAIDWSAGPYFIKTETDPAGGTTYTITGTSQLLSVPYALSAGNVTGLEKITQGSNTGWRLKGAIVANYGNIGSNAVDLSISTSASTTNGATGYEAVAMGLGTKADSYASTALGYYNIGGGDPLNWAGTDPLFEIGNGFTPSYLSNALTVLKNGTITAPSFDLAEITDNKALITKEYADANITGLEKITQGANTGWRLIGQDLTKYVNIGSNAVDLSYSDNSTSSGASGTNSTAMGANTIASGDYSTAMGANTKALGEFSTAMGYYATASGYISTAMGTNAAATADYTTAMGYSTTASGNYSTAMGYGTGASRIASTAMGKYTTASGDYSTAMGLGTKAEAYGSTAIGTYNTGDQSPAPTADTDHLFEIGNGTIANPSNALTVYRNGNTNFYGNTNVYGNTLVSGVLQARGTSWPNWGAGVDIGYDYVSSTGYIRSMHHTPDTYNDLAVGALSLRPEINGFTDLGNSYYRFRKVYTQNGVSSSSDRRLKKEIKNSNYGLNTVMQLRPVSFKWKQGDQDVNLGLIAQEVQKLLPEVIDVGTDKAKTLGMNYTELIPVVIKATQEQQLIIEKQQKEIVALKKMVTKLLKRQIIASN